MEDKSGELNQFEKDDISTFNPLSPTNRERYYSVIVQSRSLSYRTCGFRAPEHASFASLTTEIKRSVAQISHLKHCIEIVSH